MAQGSTNDRKAIDAAEKAAARHEREMGEVVIGLMASARGREWVWEQLSACSVFASTYNDTPGRAAFDEGRRAVGLHLLGQVMTYAPDQFIQAMKESNERRTVSDHTPAVRSDDPADRADDGAALGQPARDEEPGRVDPRSANGSGVHVDDTGQVHY